MLDVSKNYYLKSLQPTERPEFMYWTFVHKLNPSIVKIVKFTDVIPNDKKEFVDILIKLGAFRKENVPKWDNLKHKILVEKINRSQTEYTMSKRGSHNNNKDD